MPWPWEKRRMPPETVPQKTEVVYPEDVRYGLKHRGARLKKTELRSLVRNGESEQVRLEFLPVALYLSLKAQAEDPDREEFFIQELVRALAQHPDASLEEKREQTRSVAEQAIMTIPDDEEWTIDAHNIGAMSRHGFEHTERLFEAAAKRYAKDSRRVVIVGHAMFAGLMFFIDEFRKAKRPLQVIVPRFLGEGEGSGVEASQRNFPSGFVIEPNGLVRAIRAEDLRPPNGLVVVDDVKRKGDTEKKIGEYLTELGASAFDFEPMLDASETPNG